MPPRKANVKPSPEPQMSMSRQADAPYSTRNRTVTAQQSQPATTRPAAASSKRPTKRKRILRVTPSQSEMSVPMAGPSQTTTSMPPKRKATVSPEPQMSMSRQADAPYGNTRSQQNGQPATTRPAAASSKRLTKRKRISQVTPSQSETLSVPMAGPSQTTTSPTSEVRDEIEKLFSWNPPLFLADTRKKSVATRQPGFYDRHFSRKHVLKKVVLFPSLVKDLAELATSALNCASELPPLRGFPSAEQREDHEQRRSPLLIDEAAVAAYYSSTTSMYCSCVASNLALVAIPKWYTLLSWTQSVSGSGYAIMDGQLEFMKIEGREEIYEHADRMESERRRMVEEIRNSRSPLATFEFKSLSAGGPEVMNSIPTLGKFSWTKCPDPRCHDKPEKHHLPKKRAGQVAVGFDAQGRWNLPASTQDDDDDNSDGDNDDYDDGDDDGPYQDRHDITAQSLVQQAWAQAVRVDGTVIVLNSGNHEILCVRHRASQTLYVSNVIEPHKCVDPGYGKLHVGLYIAAIEDAIDRHRQGLSTALPAGPDNSDDDDDDSMGENNQHKNQGSGTGLNKQGHGDNNSRGFARGHNGHHGGGPGDGGKGPTDELSMKEFSDNKVQEMVHRASNRDVVFLYLQYDIYDSPIPASFVRSAPILANLNCPFSPRAIHTFGPEDCLNIILTSEIGQGATGKVHRGTLELDGAMSLDVVVKLAFDRGQQDSLRSEYDIYHHLRLKGVNAGIVTTLGLFDETEGAACALVMSYAGIPLSQATDTQSNLSQITHSALSTLDAIHRAGILHGDVHPRNILINDSGATTIIDFGHSTFCDNQRAKDKEFSQLRKLLGSLAL